ncbi:hypothetical protein E8E13_005845 [Curvularia kusanoi]|uniref:Uncharacterized protein n=1 Tax=Curvularia kusanoi TaxID=90978 RepID=A0A9P4TE40_CURKU|nr:hypothetical protein E8E13_005845 [Curvularia kusanoi]
MTQRNTRNTAKAKTSKHEAQDTDESQDHAAREDGMKTPEQETEGAPKVGDKRKANGTFEVANKSSKATKSEQASKVHDHEDSHGDASPEQVLRFLLSDAALEVCRPDDELQDLQDRGKDIVTYAQLLSPFEELLCAVILSRPISHRLGLRTIRTILNQPYEFKDADTIKSAGSDKIRQALDDAHTQHKGKTTEEIKLIAEAVEENDWNSDLENIRKQTENGVSEERELLQSSIKGLGKTGLDIFYRRIQWQWDEAFPFIDARTQASLAELGLPREPAELVDLIERNWQDVNHDNGGANDEEKKRRAYVLLLERAVGADLDKKVKNVLEEALKS